MKHDNYYLPGSPTTNDQTSNEFIRQFVVDLLEQALKFRWSLQGFGMLRLHVSDKIRLNIWDSRYRVPNVSMIHNHPWHFRSFIVNGVLSNTRYRVTTNAHSTRMYLHANIKPGPGGGMITTGDCLCLTPNPIEIYTTGDWYYQRSNEIHISSPVDGTITLNYRERVGDDVADVYWPYGTDWVSAEPRDATQDEIQQITSYALHKLHAKEEKVDKPGNL